MTDIEDVDTTKFLVELWNFRCTDLPAMRNDGKSDVYVRINFDNYKLLRTNTARKTLQPVFKCSFDFLYETRFPQKLAVKSAIIEVWQYHPITKDVLIGRCSVDLQTIATGSWAYGLELRKKGNRAGKIQFCCSMMELGTVKVGFKELKVSDIPERGDYHLRYYFNLDRDHIKRSKVIHDTQTLEFEKLSPVKFQAGVRTLMTECLVIELRLGKKYSHDDEDKRVGIIRVSFIDHMNDVINLNPIHLSTDFVGPKVGEPVAHFEADMLMAGVPKMAQLMGISKCLDDGIHGGHKMFEWMQDPPKWHDGQNGVYFQPKVLQRTHSPGCGMGDDDDALDVALKTPRQCPPTTTTTTTTEPSAAPTASEATTTTTAAKEDSNVAESADEKPKKKKKKHAETPAEATAEPQKEESSPTEPKKEETKPTEPAKIESPATKPGEDDKTEPAKPAEPEPSATLTAGGSATD